MLYPGLHVRLRKRWRTGRPGVCFLSQSIFWMNVGTRNFGLKEAAQIRSEALIIAFQQVTPFVPRNRFFAEETWRTCDSYIDITWIRDQGSVMVSHWTCDLFFGQPADRKIWQSRSTKVFHFGRWPSQSPFVEIHLDENGSFFNDGQCNIVFKNMQSGSPV